MKVLVENCNGCAECVEVCPVNAIDINKVKIDYEKCMHVRCMRCYFVCPDDAIKVKGLIPVKM